MKSKNFEERIIMGVFEDIFVKAKAAAGALGEKAGQYVDVSKLNIKLAEFKNDLKSEFENLGKIVYESEKNDVENRAGINASIAQIDNITLQIEETKKQIASIKNKILCKSCGSQNEVNSIYCAKCGEKLTENSKSTKEVEDDFSDFDD